MDSRDPFSNSLYADQLLMAESELSAFLKVVTDLFGPEQAGLAEEDWLHEADLMDSPPRSTSRNWGAVTVAASARLENRLDVARQHPVPPRRIELIRGYCRHHRPIVRVPGFCCDAVVPMRSGRKDVWSAGARESTDERSKFHLRGSGRFGGTRVGSIRWSGHGALWSRAGEAGGRALARRINVHA